MKKYIYIYLLVGCFFLISGIQAQVKIGDNTPPSSFSILELETLLQKGGLRLPQLSQQKCEALKTYLNGLSANEKQAANGLVVYNTELPGLQYWDGTDWVSVKFQHGLIGKNGVTALDAMGGGLELGGGLTETSTTIDLNNYSLNFPVSGNTDQFIVSNSVTGENPLNIIDGKVGIGGTNAPEKVLDIYNSDGDIPAIKITNSNEKSGYLLSSDFFGNALWQPLKPLASVVYGKLKDGYTYGGTNYPNDYNITADPLRLSRGKWLIIGKFTARSGAGTDQNQYYSYLKLRKSTKKDPLEEVAPSNGAQYDANYTKLTTTSALPSRMTYIGPDGGDENGAAQIYVTPQVLYYAEVNGNDEYFHILVSSSRQFKTTKAYGDYFFALRIDGMGMAVAVNGSTNCSAFASISRTLETGQALSPEPTGTINITLTSGSLYLEENDYIGSVNGINIVVTGGPYNLTTGTTTPVSVKLAGTLETRVPSGSFRIPVSIANATFSPNCAGPTIIVPTKGSFNCNALSNYNIYTGRGRTLNITGASVGLDLTSGSVGLTAGQALSVVNSGLSLSYDNINNTTIYATNNVNLPVKISGTISSTASGQFTLSPSLNFITACTGGATINVVIAQLNCGAANINPSNKSIYSVVPIDIVVDPASASYPLKSGQLLGNQSDIRVTYIGDDITLTPGTHTINVLVSSGSTIKNVGNYPVNLSALYANGFESCVMNVTVMHYGKFENTAPIEIPIRAESVNSTIQVPLTVTTNSVTINPGDVLGSVTANGKTYQAIADNSSPIVVAAGNTSNIPVRVTGPGDDVVRSYTINLNRSVGVDSNNIMVSFVAHGSFGTVTPLDLQVSTGNVNADISVPLNFTSTQTVTFNNGDVLGSVTANGKTYQVIVNTPSPITVNSPGNINIPAKVTGPEETTAGRRYTIPMNKTIGILSSNVVVNFNN